MFIVSFLLVWGWQTPAFQQTTPPPSFFIETIEVVNHRWVSQSLVISQARLREGMVIPEPELRKAVNRIRQLPVVRDARFSLVKGSRRGRYKLVIRLQEEKLLFFDAETQKFRERHGTTFSQDRLNLGGRLFLGDTLMAYATYQPTWRWTQPDQALRQGYQLGVSEFDGLGRGIFLDVRLKIQEGFSQPFGQDGTADSEPTREWAMNTAYPVRTHQWIRFEGRHLHSEDRQTRRLFNPILNQTLELSNQIEQRDISGSFAWEWNSADDSFLPHAGATAQTGIGWGRLRTRNLVAGLGEPETFETRRRSVRYFSRYRHYFPMSDEHSWNLSADLQVTESSDRDNDRLSDQFDREQAEFDLGYQWRVNGPGANQRFGQFYLGSTLTYRYEHIESESPAVFGSVLKTKRINRTASLEIFAAYRGQWGLLRFGFQYFDANRDSATDLVEVAP